MEMGHSQTKFVHGSSPSKKKSVSPFKMKSRPSSSATSTNPDAISLDPPPIFTVPSDLLPHSHLNKQAADASRLKSMSASTISSAAGSKQSTLNSASHAHEPCSNALPHSPHECKQCSSVRAAFSSLKYSISTSSLDPNLFNDPDLVVFHKSAFSHLMKYVSANATDAENSVKVSDAIEDIVEITHDSSFQMLELISRGKVTDYLDGVKEPGRPFISIPLPLERPVAPKTEKKTTSSGIPHSLIIQGLEKEFQNMRLEINKAASTTTSSQQQLQVSMDASAMEHVCEHCQNNSLKGAQINTNTTRKIAIPFPKKDKAGAVLPQPMSSSTPNFAPPIANTFSFSVSQRPPNASPSLIPKPSSQPNPLQANQPLRPPKKSAKLSNEPPKPAPQPISTFKQASSTVLETKQVPTASTSTASNAPVPKRPTVSAPTQPTKPAQVQTTEGRKIAVPASKIQNNNTQLNAAKVAEKVLPATNQQKTQVNPTNAKPNTANNTKPQSAPTKPLQAQNQNVKPVKPATPYTIFLRKFRDPPQSYKVRRSKFKSLVDKEDACFFCEYEQVYGGQFWHKRRRKGSKPASIVI